MKAGGTVEGYELVSFAKAVPVIDTRGSEELSDRAVLGAGFGSHGYPVAAIALAGSWFVVTTRGVGASGSVEEREYRVPVTNVTSARALPPEADGGNGA